MTALPKLTWIDLAATSGKIGHPAEV